MVVMMIPSQQAPAGTNVILVHKVLSMSLDSHLYQGSINSEAQERWKQQ